MLAALLATASLTFMGVRRIFRNQLDRALQGAASLQAAVLGGGEGIPTRSGGPDFERFVEEVNRFVVQRDGAGRITGASDLHARTLPLDSAAFATALAGAPSWATVRWRNGAARTFYVRAPPGSPPDAVVIQVAAVMGPFYRASRAILAEILGLALVATLATLVGARWLAGSVTGIVDQIAAEAAAIRPGVEVPQLAVEGHFRELQGLVRVLNETLSRQHVALEQQRQMVSDVAHELRTPVTALLGSVEVGLRNPRSPEAYRRLLLETHEELEQLSALVETLLLLARLDAGQLQVRVEPLDLTRMVQDAVERVRDRARGRILEVEAPESVRLRGDRKMLGLLLDHLLDNVIRHTPDGTLARITVRGEAARVLLAVDDSGPGIDAALRPRVFDRFVRGDPARTRTAGAGLGLTLAAAVVAAHRGAIAAEPSSLGGLRVALEIPGALDSLRGGPGGTAGNGHRV